MVDIKQLRFLVALEQTRHFGRAAALCHVAQPTLSMRIRELEAELGLELIIRNQRFEGFTEAGLRILAWAHTVLSAEQGLFVEAAACRGQLVGTLRLGVVPLAGFDPMKLVSQFSSVHPHLRFQLKVMSSEQVVDQVASNQLDLGLSYIERLDREQFDIHLLAQTRMGVLHDSRFFQFDTPEVTWQALGELPLGLLSTGMHFRQSIDHGLRGAGVVPQPKIETDSVLHLLHAVLAGLCCAVVPFDSGLECYDDAFRLTPITDAQTLAPLGLIMRRREPRSVVAVACFEAGKAFSL